MVIIFRNFLVPPKGCTKPIHLPPLKRPNTIQHHERSGLKSIPQGANKTWYLLPTEIKMSGSFESFKSEIKYLGCWHWHRLYAIHISNLVKFTYIHSTLVCWQSGLLLTGILISNTQTENDGSSVPLPMSLKRSLH